MQEQQARIFFIRYIIVIACVLVGSYLVRWWDLPITDNDLIRQYQTKKLRSGVYADVVIVGDSSAGNAIDATHLSETSGRHVVNLALSGGFSFPGTFNMIRHAKTSLGAKRFIIIQTTDIWGRPPDVEGFFETLWRGDSLPAVSYLNRSFELTLQHIFNVREFGWLVTYWLHGTQGSSRIEHDYLMQNTLTFANGMLRIDPEIFITDTHMKEHIAMLTVIGNYCEMEHLTCVYVHGPMHSGIVQNSKNALMNITEAVHNIPGIMYMPVDYAFDPMWLGDKPDHIDVQFKQKATRRYYEALKSYIFTDDSTI